MDYFIYRGVNSATLGLSVEDYSTPILTGAKYTFSDIPGAHGSARSGSGKLRDKFIQIKCGVVGTDPEDLQVKLSNITKFLSVPGRLQLWDRAVSYDAVLESATDSNLEDFWCELVLMFRVNPIKYGAVVNIAKTSSPITVNNPGNEDAKGVITVTMGSTVSSLQVTLVQTGESIYIGDNFVSGNVVEIDLKSKKVRKNGVLIMDKVYFSSKYFSFPAGTSTVTLSSGQAAITFESRWY